MTVPPCDEPDGVVVGIIIIGEEEEELACVIDGIACVIDGIACIIGDAFDVPEDCIGDVIDGVVGMVVDDVVDGFIGELLDLGPPQPTAYKPTTPREKTIRDALAIMHTSAAKPASKHDASIPWIQNRTSPYTVIA